MSRYIELTPTLRAEVRLVGSPIMRALLTALETAERQLRAAAPERIVLTDANYGNPVEVRADHITAATIVAENTYRDGTIPDGVFRRTLVYTLGGSCLSVREEPAAIWELVDAASPAPSEETE